MASCLGDLKQVQDDSRFDSHLTGVRKGEFLLAHKNNSTPQRLSMK